MSGYAHVRNGSDSEVAVGPGHFRLSPSSGHRRGYAACLKRANSGLAYHGKCRRFDQSVGSIRYENDTVSRQYQYD
jgi:hypothetical protein